MNSSDGCSGSCIQPARAHMWCCSKRLHISSGAWLQSLIWPRRLHQCGVLTLSAAQFPELLEASTSLTQQAYAREPLFDLPGPHKGRVMQKAIQHTLANSFPSIRFSEAPSGAPANGHKRGGNQGEFDFMCNDRRVECKGTSMAWDRDLARWRARWVKVKLDKFDDLLLALHSPGQIDVVQHDHVTGITNAGCGTSVLGYVVQAVASRGNHDACRAREEILEKMRTHSCRHLATMPCDSGMMGDLVLRELHTETAKLAALWYKGVPLSDHTSSSRALRLQAVALAVDRMIHANSVFDPQVYASEVVGTLQPQRRGKNRGSADWWRDKIRVEFKSALLCWVSRRWQVKFGHVKFASQVEPNSAHFDELWLGLYTPFGLYILQYSGEIGRCRTGALLDDFGHAVIVGGPKHQQCPEAALTAILGKFEQSGCKLLANFSWR